MEKAVKLSALANLPNTQLRILKELSERLENGAAFVKPNDLVKVVGVERHAVIYALSQLRNAGLIVIDYGKINFAKGVIVNCTG